MKPHLYILQGQTPVPVEDALEWGRWFENAQRHVDCEEVAPGIEVSTVFLGIDHGYSWLPDARPLLFETMVFKGDKALEEFTERYSTWAGAEGGHKRTVAKVREHKKKLDPQGDN